MTPPRPLTTIALAFALAGCTAGAVPVGPAPASTPMVPTSAALDWDAATITLPLDAFGMSSAELRAVKAAISIEFARCVTGSRPVDRSVIDEAARSLAPVTPDPSAHHWLYGVWDAPFVAQHGWRPFPETDPEPRLMATDAATTERCLNSEAALALRPIATIVGDDGPSSTLLAASGDSRTRTLATPAFTGLMDSLDACLKEAGYPTSRDTEGVQIDFTADASEQTLLEGMVASATCNDALRITQQAADIEAGLQATYIHENLAELVAAKAVADERVARAREVLREVGL